MKKIMVLIFIFTVHYCFAQQQFQLAMPLMKYRSVFFADTASFTINFNQPGSAVHYTLNGEEPTETDLLYKTPVIITQRTIVKAKAFSNSFAASETVTAEFIKDGKKIRQVSFSKPDDAYATTNVSILNDNTGGNMNFKSGTWLGYKNDTVEINIELKKKENINSVLVNILQDENSWLFLPEQVLVYYYNDKQKAFLPAGKKFFFSESPAAKKSSAKEIILSQKIKTNTLKLIVLPLKKIPGWHPGKGNHAWLFIDEIKVY